MNQITVRVPAKINFLLDVKAKREDGYHEIETVFQTVSVFDRITITESSCDSCMGFSVSCDKAGIPCNKTNIVYKAGRLLEEYTGKAFMDNIHIEIQKNIPSQAGMGGGSADAAAVMIALNKIYELGLSEEELISIGAKAGADVPFFILGGTCYAGGIGEKLVPCKNNIGRLPLVIAKGEEGVSTAAGYRAVDEWQGSFENKTGELCRALETGDREKLAALVSNKFTEAVGLKEVADIRRIMRDRGALGTEMTGSGSAVFGIFESEEAAKSCCEALKGYSFAVVCYAEDLKAEII